MDAAVTRPTCCGWSPDSGPSQPSEPLGTVLCGPHRRRAQLFASGHGSSPCPGASTESTYHLIFVACSRRLLASRWLLLSSLGIRCPGPRAPPAAHAFFLSAFNRWPLGTCLHPSAEGAPCPTTVSRYLAEASEYKDGSLLHTPCLSKLASLGDVDARWQPMIRLPTAFHSQDEMGCLSLPSRELFIL